METTAPAELRVVRRSGDLELLTESTLGTTVPPCVRFVVEFTLSIWMEFA
jgi:hypothetical protein